jgi:hypothetical protein
MKKILFVLMVCVAGGILSCAGNAGNQNQDQYQDKFNLAKFDSERAAWKALGIDAYRFTGIGFAMSMGAFPITVTVLPGAEPEFTYDEKKVNQQHLGFISRGWPFRPFYGSTIDELFDSIRETALHQKYDPIRYTQEYHYPESYTHGSDFLEITFFEVLDGGE